MGTHRVQDKSIHRKDASFDVGEEIDPTDEELEAFADRLAETGSDSSSQRQAFAQDADEDVDTNDDVSTAGANSEDPTESDESKTEADEPAGEANESTTGSTQTDADASDSDDEDEDEDDEEVEIPNDYTTLRRMAIAYDGDEINGRSSKSEIRDVLEDLDSEKLKELRDDSDN